MENHVRAATRACAPLEGTISPCPVPYPHEGPSSWKRVLSLGSHQQPLEGWLQGSTRIGVSGGDMGLPKPLSGSAESEGVGTQEYNTLFSLYKAGLRSSPSDKTPVDGVIQ